MSTSARTSAAGKALVSYERWGDVPAGLVTRTRLGDADPPRRPGGPVRARVRDFNWRGKQETFDLYAVAESVPTAATGRQLAAAAQRRAAGRGCEGCGGVGQLPLLEHGGRRVCAACRHLAQLAEMQEALRARRAELAVWAGGLLSGRLAVVWVELTAAPLSGSGRARPPLAGRVQVADEAGRVLEDVLVRLAGPRTGGAPAEAVSAEAGAERIARVLAGRRRVVWGPLGDVTARLRVLGHPLSLDRALAVPGGHGVHWPDDVGSRYAQWCGELDPATGRLRTPWPPGSADRLWYVIAQMAGTDPAEGTDAVGKAAQPGE
ncbi:hypothetical protein [Streptomyces spectabilis]|uniref:Uncharacterized protein n=1 Tax=Streptomyces spectabilis TaxID=68270 RepID=A0A7W8B284_STRST|nr:hypothetical protein [Streptomyces spectabilis]MBB5109024.1 hypothetical protein [Streptomyces spectabilis]GGV50723.1 hypothetical protein GCM10010245_79970 [Streptomyces spectabilis]